MLYCFKAYYFKVLRCINKKQLKQNQGIAKRSQKISIIKNLNISNLMLAIKNGKVFIRLL